METNPSCPVEEMKKQEQIKVRLFVLKCELVYVFYPIQITYKRGSTVLRDFAIFIAE